MDESKNAAGENADKHSAGRNELWEIARVIFIALAIVIPIRYFIVQPFIVRGASMEPTYEDSEYLIVDELSYYFRPPERGEVIVFRYPHDPSQFFIKRIVGLPGETIEIRDGVVRIINDTYPNGFILDESYLPSSRRTYIDTNTTLGTDEYFVMGDNRSASSDSRIWGALADRFIVGRALLRAWPVTKFGIVLDE